MTYSPYSDEEGRFRLTMRRVDPAVWSILAGGPVHVRRKFPWWKLWRWPGLLLERRSCKALGIREPLGAFDGLLAQDGDDR